MPKSSASEISSAGYVRTPWDEDDSLVDFARSAFEAASAESRTRMEETEAAEPTIGGASIELEGALEHQLRDLDRSFGAPQRHHRSAFHELALPPQREVQALPAPPTLRHAADDTVAEDPWEDEDDAWAAAPAAEADDEYGWPDRDAEPALARGADAHAGPHPSYDHDQEDEEDRRADAYWSEAWQRPADAPSPSRSRIALAPSMMVVAGLVAMAGGAVVAMGIQHMSASPDIAPISEANASIMTASALPRLAQETVNAPQQASKLSYDRVDAIAPPVASGAAEVERDPPMRTVAVSRSEAAALADRAPLGSASAEATTIASVNVTEPVDDVDEVAGGPAQAPRVKQTARTNSFVNMRSKGISDSPTVMIVPANATVDLFGCKGWCEVAYNGRRGFIYKTFLGEKPMVAKARDIAADAKGTAALPATGNATPATTATAATAANARQANAAPATTTAGAAAAANRRWLDGLGFYR